ncbi:hypothetical protein C8034_v004973 [Colletotrichum sidae]|uniref:Uncharacterized protein n=1 Tax=Colletotrichum sidae TaxID=1347389 RepID=A0A4V3I3F1_9PEZI|nr:hypothetical protein C8034_v004973 [Colletotrichum sidae]
MSEHLAHAQDLLLAIHENRLPSFLTQVEFGFAGCRDFYELCFLFEVYTSLVKDCGVTAQRLSDWKDEAARFDIQIGSQAGSEIFSTRVEEELIAQYTEFHDALLMCTDHLKWPSPSRRHYVDKAIELSYSGDDAESFVDRRFSTRLRMSSATPAGTGHDRFIASIENLYWSVENNFALTDKETLIVFGFPRCHATLERQFLYSAYYYLLRTCGVDRGQLHDWLMQRTLGDNMAIEFRRNIDTYPCEQFLGWVNDHQWIWNLSKGTEQRAAIRRRPNFDVKFVAKLNKFRENRLLGNTPTRTWL